MVLSVADDRRKATESPDKKNGIFSVAVIRGLKGADDINDGFMQSVSLLTM